MLTVIAYLPNGSLEAQPVPDMAKAIALARKWSLGPVRKATINHPAEKAPLCVYEKGVRVACRCEPLPEVEHTPHRPSAP
jgi:hypothetical protein